MKRLNIIQKIKDFTFPYKIADKSKYESNICISKENLYKEKLDDLYCILEKRIDVIMERAANVMTLNSCNFNYKLFKKYQSELFFLEFLQEKIKEIIK